MIDIDLPALRIEWLKNPLLADILAACIRNQRNRLTTLVWCQEKLFGPHSKHHFKSLVQAFYQLESTGFGVLEQPTHQARARFHWSVLPVAIDRGLRQESGTLSPRDLLPEAAQMGLQLPVTKVEPPERAGWTRHPITLRPGGLAEVFVPDDLTVAEAKWLGDYLQQLSAQGK